MNSFFPELRNLLQRLGEVRILDDVRGQVRLDHALQRVVAVRLVDRGADVAEQLVVVERALGPVRQSTSVMYMTASGSANSVSIHS